MTFFGLAQLIGFVLFVLVSFLFLIQCIGLSCLWLSS